MRQASAFLPFSFFLRQFSIFRQQKLYNTPCCGPVHCCDMPVDDIQYSEKYYDATYEYRHVILPKDIAKLVPRTHLLTETEWRNLGVQQSPGWMHYMYHPPEPHVLLFRRPRTDLPQSRSNLGTCAENNTCMS